MNIQEYISSGVLELYGLGVLSAAEEAEVEKMLQHAEVQAEWQRIQSALEALSMHMAVQPPAELKSRTELALYKSQAGAGKPYPPLVEPGCSFDEIEAWVKARQAEVPVSYDNVHLQELNSTDRVLNLLAYVKHGHEPEIHDDYYEYIVVLEGSCTMDFEGEIRTYKKGDIIDIPLSVLHTATVTSAGPMQALVQRQFI